MVIFDTKDNYDNSIKWMLYLNIVDVDYSMGGFLCGSCSINRKPKEYLELLYKLTHTNDLILGSYDEGIIYSLVKDLLMFFNENSGLNIRSEKFVLNSLFNIKN